MCVGLVASSTEEMAARSIAYHAHGTPDGDKYCCYPWLVCHDIKSAMHPLLAQARPRMINYLTSISELLTDLIPVADLVQPLAREAHPKIFGLPRPLLVT